MAEVLYGQAEIGSNSTGFAQKKVYLADVDFKPQGVVVTGLQDPSRSPTTVDTFAFQVTALQEGAFQLNIMRVDSTSGWGQELWISYIAW